MFRKKNHNNDNINNEKDIRISKALSWILRHGAIEQGIPISTDGYINVELILRHKSFRNYQLEDIQRIVTNDLKNRYKLLKNENNSYQIKANQGHSIKEVNELNLRKILSHEEIPLAVHGTYRKFWDKIKIEGLKRMARNHIHFTVSANRISTEKISGFRENCEILIYLNVKKALENDIEIFISENNVILTAGQDGVLKPDFFEKVIDRKTNSIVKF